MAGNAFTNLSTLSLSDNFRSWFDKTNEIVEGWTQNDRNLINNLAPVEGLQTKFKNIYLN